MNIGKEEVCQSRTTRKNLSQSSEFGISLPLMTLNQTTETLEVPPMDSLKDLGDGHGVIKSE